MPSYWRAVLDQWVAAGSRAVAFGDPAQRTLDAAATRLRYDMAVAAAFRGHSHAHQSAPFPAQCADSRTGGKYDG